MSSLRTQSNGAVGAVSKHGLAILATLAALVPLYFMLSTSFKTEVGYA